jgi:hypothetical protein
MFKNYKLLIKDIINSGQWWKSFDSLLCIRKGLGIIGTSGYILVKNR